MPVITRHRLIMIMSVVVTTAGCDSPARPIVTPTEPARSHPAPAPPPTPAPLPPKQAPARIGGEYTLELTASETCTMLPEWSRVRSYDAVIDQDEGATSATIRITSGNFHSWFAARFKALIDGD